jgi:iron complex outermembrane receptor protein
VVWIAIAIARKGDNVNKNKLLSILVVAASGVSAPGLHAEQVLEEIIITAERRETSLQSTPVTVSAFTTDTLDRMQVVEATELQKYVPNLTMVQGIGAPGKVDLYLRGAGDQIGAIILSESGVGVYIDDVFMPRLSVANIELLELERIEVLRGPQGTLYGRNSMGGAIRYITKTPDGSRSGNVGAGFGSFDAFNVHGHFQAPIVEDRVAGSFTGSYRESGDWYTNTALGEDRGNREALAFNGKLVWLAPGALSATLSLAYSDEKNDGGEMVARDPDTLQSITGDFRDVQSPFDTFGDSEQFRVALNFTYDFAGGTSFRSITAYQDLTESSSFDLTGRGLLNRTLEGEVDVVTQELQLRGVAFDQSLDWLIGGFLFFEDGFQTVQDTVFFTPRAATVIDVETDSYAVFAEGTYHLTDRTSFTAGLRYTDDEKVLDGAMATPADPSVPIPVSNVITSDDFTTRLVLDHNFSDDVFGFINVSRGFKAGSFNGLAVLNPVAFSTGFEPETVWAYEVGLKADLQENRLRTNVNVFFNDFSDLQGLNTDEAGFTTISNIADADVYGIEVEFTYLATDQFRLFGTVSRQWDEYTKVDPTSIVDPSFKLNRASDWYGTLAFEYRLPLAGSGANLGLTGFWSYRSEYFNDIINSPIVRTDKSSLLDLGAFYETAGGTWKFTLAGKNLTDEDIYNKGLGVIGVTGQPNMPSSWSLSARYRF